MSGFETEWLGLRETADIRARDKTLLAAAADAVKTSGGTILDIGSGTGSSYRALSPLFQEPLRWRLFDSDEKLLEEAGRRHGNAVELIPGDLNALDTLPLEDVGLVTASALFDLCSKDFIHQFVDRLAATGTGTGLYAALSYDGGMTWSKSHPLDEVFVATFNAHQLSDKGFGPALGPRAWKVLAECLGNRGYTVQTAESPWAMTATDGDLQRLFLNGIVRAVLEYGELDEAEIRDWIDYRHRMVEAEDSLCRVGHQDVLALR